MANDCYFFGDGATFANTTSIPVEMEVLVESQLAVERPFTLRFSTSAWACGDGFVDYTVPPITALEECDDGNTQNGDGCDDSCRHEVGWNCDRDGPCRPSVCGDGIRDHEIGESCEDGNSQAGDGCDSECHIEAGWVCGFDQACRPIVCGDGILDRSPLDGTAAVPPVLPLPPLETCDDGNALDDDGCSSACLVEPGWLCDEEDVPCYRLAPGEWCSSALPLAAGSYDFVVPTGDRGGDTHLVMTIAVPADRVLHLTGTTTFAGYVWLAHPDRCTEYLPFTLSEISSEAPFDLWFGPPNSMEEGEDLGETAFLWFTSGEGASPALTLDQVELLVPSCGDGVVNSASLEECDDGNSNAGDGCDELCQREPGFSCLPYDFGCRQFGCSEIRPEQPCQAYVCGDGQITRPAEACDDGNSASGDGCSAECQLEPGYLCRYGEDAYECVSLPSGDLCSIAQPLGAGVNTLQADMSGMAADESYCPDCPVTRWFSLTQNAGETTTLILRGESVGYVHTFVDSCPFESSAEGAGYGAGYTLSQRIRNDTASARSVFIEVFSFERDVSGAFELIEKTGPSGCGDLWLDSAGTYGNAEACDDGNTTDADGCSAQCAIEPGHTCSGQPSLCSPL